MMHIPIEAPRDERALPELGDRAGRATYADGGLTPWACGSSEDAAVCNDERCVDIVPELFVELI